VLEERLKQGKLAEAAWSDRSIVAPKLDIQALDCDYQRIVGGLRRATDEKKNDPGNRQDTSDLRREVMEAKKRIEVALDVFNRETDAANDLIDVYLDTLAAIDISSLEREVGCCQWATDAGRDPGKCVLEAFLDAEKALQIATQNKERASKSAQDAAQRVATRYRECVNSFLKRFGVTFSLSKFEDRNQGKRGGAERNVVYGFSVARSADTLGDCEMLGLEAFGEALSDGDKRTLALSFFLARVTGEESLNDTIIVLDDPICSLGAHRRSETRNVIYDLADRAAQVVVLCHDASFLLEVLDRAPRKYENLIVRCEIRANNGKVDFCEFDERSHREDSTMRAIRRIREYLNDQSSQGEDQIFSDLRISLEGYLRLKYYPMLNRCNGVGEMVGRLSAGSLGASAKILMQRQSYAGQTVQQELAALPRDLNCPHHAGYSRDKSLPPRQELLNLANRVMAIVQG
jgi:energy-coupling factor transporter ATP-binding protein EcfA2